MVSGVVRVAVVGSAVLELDDIGSTRALPSMPSGAVAVRWAALFSSPFFHPSVLVDREVLGAARAALRPRVSRERGLRPLDAAARARRTATTWPSRSCSIASTPARLRRRAVDSSATFQRARRAARDRAGRAGAGAGAGGARLARRRGPPVEAEQLEDAASALRRARARLRARLATVRAAWPKPCSRGGRPSARSARAPGIRHERAQPCCARPPRLDPRFRTHRRGPARAAAGWLPEALDARRSRGWATWSENGARNRLLQADVRVERLARAIRVAAVFPEPTPYRAPLLDRVAALPEVDLTVIYAARDRRRQNVAHRSAAPGRLPARRARARRARDPAPRLSGHARCRARARAARPDVVVVSGWSTFAAQAAIAGAALRARAVRPRRREPRRGAASRLAAAGEGRRRAARRRRRRGRARHRDARATLDDRARARLPSACASSRTRSTSRSSASGPTELARRRHELRQRARRGAGRRRRALGRAARAGEGSRRPHPRGRRGRRSAAPARPRRRRPGARAARGPRRRARRATRLSPATASGSGSSSSTSPPTCSRSSRSASRGRSSSTRRPRAGCRSSSPTASAPRTTCCATARTASSSTPATSTRRRGAPPPRGGPGRCASVRGALARARAGLGLRPERRRLPRGVREAVSDTDGAGWQPGGMSFGATVSTPQWNSALAQSP